MSSSITKEQLLDATYKILIDKGIKSTTMDVVAKTLKISKRTLYEIFDNKTDLITQTLEQHHANMRREAERLMLGAPNVMMGLLLIINLHRDDVRRVNIEFFKDMDRLYPSMRKDYDQRREKTRGEMMKMFQEGVRQGYFREDVNFYALSFIMQLVMEAVKSPNISIPEGLEFVDIFDTMTLSFLRTIVSPKGLQMLDELIDLHNNRQLASEA